MTLWLAAREPPHLRRQLRDMAVLVARGEIGRGELKPNGGPDVWKYTRAITRGAWCAAFVSWVYEASADRVPMAIPFARSHGARQLFRRIAAAGYRSSVPVVGGVALWRRGLLPWQGHIGIVTAVWDGGFACIEGNVGSFKRTQGRVAAFEHSLDEPRLLGFAAP